MKVQINTDGNIEGQEALSNWVSDSVRNAVDQNTEQITRVEVHLSDLDGRKHSHIDKRCMLEARLKGRQPIAVSHKAASLEDAVDGAVQKLARMIEHNLSRTRALEGRMTDPPPAVQTKSRETPDSKGEEPGFGKKSCQEIPDTP